MNDTMTSYEVHHPICSVCEKRTNGRKMFLPVIDGISKDPDGCLCEHCFKRIPEGIQNDLVCNAANLANPGFNSIIIEALKNTPAYYDLNEDCYLLSNAALEYRFEKFPSKKQLNDAAKQYSKSGIKVIERFEQGKIVVDKKSKKVLDTSSLVIV